MEEKGDFEGATNAWKRLIDNYVAVGQVVAGDIYARAGKTALKAGRKDLAEVWLGLARYHKYSDPELEMALADLYHEHNEVPKEIGTLEFFRLRYPGNCNEAQVNGRLFDLYCRMNDSQQAFKLWAELDESERNSQEHLDRYFDLLVYRGLTEKADSVANLLLELYGNHAKATDWLEKDRS